MAGINIIVNGVLRTVELIDVKLMVKDPDARKGALAQLQFFIYEVNTRKRVVELCPYTIILDDTSAEAFWMAYCLNNNAAYITLCTKLGVSSSGVPANMTSEISAL
jgi:hypothetical protein